MAAGSESMRSWNQRSPSTSVRTIRAMSAPDEEASKAGATRSGPEPVVTADAFCVSRILCPFCCQASDRFFGRADVLAFDGLAALQQGHIQRSAGVVEIPQRVGRQ